MDWRITNQINYLKDSVLLFKSFPNESEHTHCEFCMARFSKDDVRKGYTTLDQQRWICAACFKDFKEMFHFVLADDSVFADMRFMDVVDKMLQPITFNALSAICKNLMPFSFLPEAVTIQPCLRFEGRLLAGEHTIPKQETTTFLKSLLLYLETLADDKAILQTITEYIKNHDWLSDLTNPTSMMIMNCKRQEIS